MLTLVLAVVIGLIAVLAGVAAIDRRRLQRQLVALRRLVRVDPELVLRTSEAFGEELEIEVLRVERSGRPSSLTVFGLEQPSQDAAEADANREAFVHVLRSTVRTIDVAYRTGTNEFALILPDTRARGALVAATRVEQSATANGVRVTAGVAETGPGLDRHTLFRNAYCALLSAGTDGRPAVLAYSPELERGTPADRLTGLADIEPAEGSPRPHR